MVCHLLLEPGQFRRLRHAQAAVVLLVDEEQPALVHDVRLIRPGPLGALQPYQVELPRRPRGDRPVLRARQVDLIRAVPGIPESGAPHVLQKGRRQLFAECPFEGRGNRRPQIPRRAPPLADPLVPVPSEDGAAALLVVPVQERAASEVVEELAPLVALAERVRELAGERFDGTGATAYVGGLGGLLADFSEAFGGIDGILLGVALAVVLVILLVVYRSPILPVAVLLTSLFGLGLASVVVYHLADNDVIELSGQSQGILFILVVGAATSALLSLDLYNPEAPPVNTVHPDGRVTYSAKGGRAETAVCALSTVALVNAWVARRARYARAGSPPALFLAQGGTRPTRSWLYQMTRRRGQEAGLDHINPHLFRHRRALELIERAGPRAAQMQLGHRQLSTTVNHYGFANAQGLRHAVRAVPMGFEQGES